MSLHNILRGIYRFTVVVSILLIFCTFCLLAVVGAEHIVYDHMLFGLLK